MGMAVWAWLVVALAQETPLPAVVDVPVLDGETICPSVPETHIPALVVTNLGIGVHDGAGAYPWLCPEKWGGDPEPQVVATPDAGRLLVRTDEGEVWRSNDGGCTFARVDLGEGVVAVDLLFWRSGFWILTRGGAEGALLLRENAGALLPVTAWTDFVPDGMHPEGASYLWLAGVLPVAQVRRLSLEGGLLDNVAIANLPADSANLERLEPVAAEPGEAWLRATRLRQRWTWNATVFGEGDLRQIVVVDDPERYTSIQGPVWWRDRWIVSQDAKFYETASRVGVWSGGEADAPWTCLTAVGESVFACTLPAMLAIVGHAEGGGVRTRPVVSLLQLAPPEPSCSTPSCTSAWTEAAAAYGITATEPEDQVVCPDGRTLNDVDPQNGCGCNGSARAPALGLVSGLVWGLRRRRSTGSTGAERARSG